MVSIKRGFIFRILVLSFLLLVSGCGQGVSESSTLDLIQKDELINSGPSFSVPSKDRSNPINVKKYFFEDGEFPLTFSNFNALSVSGRVKFSSNDGYARVILNSEEGDRLLVYSTDEIYDFLELSFSDICLETCNIGHTISSGFLEIQLHDAELTLTSIKYFPAGTKFTKTSEKIRFEQYSKQIAELNKKLRNRNLPWIAGSTEVSKLPFKEKESLFGGELPNLGGFLYYKEGYFTLPWGDLPKEPKTYREQEPFHFNWQNRHGIDWMTPVKSQGSCGSCWAFGPIGAIEAGANLFYNQLINLDLSEQDLVSCSGAGNCSGGRHELALEYIQENSNCLEDCFPYTESEAPCEDKCDNWQEDSWSIESTERYFLSTTFDIKKALVNKGPISSLLYFDGLGSHVMTLVGFGEIVPGAYQMGQEPYIEEDSPFIGKTYWFFKNSWGDDWGLDGYAKLISPPDVSESYSIYRPYSDSVPEVLCQDNDGDGFCWWGLSNEKPDTCPSSCSQNNIMDCDDTNRLIRACTDNFICGNHPFIRGGEVEEFGDYEEHNQRSCCGDDFDEYPIVGGQAVGSVIAQIPSYRCCDNPEDSLYSVDYYPHLFGFGEGGSGQGQFSSIKGIDIYDNLLYATDAYNHRIQIFEIHEDTLEFVNMFTTIEPGGIESLIDLAVYNDRIYVSNSFGQVKIFDMDGEFITFYGDGGEEWTGHYYDFGFLQGVYAHDDKLYVVDSGYDKIHIFNIVGDELEFLREFGREGSGLGEFINPQDIFVNENRIYVSDLGNDRIQIFSSLSDKIGFVGVFGSFGTGEGEFHFPIGIYVYDDRIYVADNQNERVQIFDTGGNFVGLFDDFNGPIYDVVVYEDRAYVSDTPRIEVFSTNLATDWFCG